MKKIYRVVRYRNTNKLVYGFNKKISKKKNYFVNSFIENQEETPKISFVYDEIFADRATSPMSTNMFEIPLTMTPQDSITDGVYVILNSDGVDVTNDINVYFIEQTINIPFDAPLGEYTIKYYSLSKPEIFAEMRLIVVSAKPTIINIIDDEGTILGDEIESIFDPNLDEHTYRFNYLVEPFGLNQTVRLVVPEDINYVVFDKNQLTNISVDEYSYPTNEPIVMNISKELLISNDILYQGGDELATSFEFELIFETESPIPNEEPITFTKIFVFNVIQ